MNKETKFLLDIVKEANEISLKKYNITSKGGEGYGNRIKKVIE